MDGTAHLGAPVGVVGIGMSAGGTESLLPLLAELPLAGDAQPCWVVVQHMPPDHPSLLARILTHRLGRPVDAVTDGLKPRHGSLLVAPSHADVVFDGQVLRLVEPGPGVLPRPSIDRFFTSLAHHLGARSAGVILSGTGSDGAVGLRRIREAGGLVVVQSPHSARYVGMPEAAIRSSAPPHVLPPDDMAQVLLAGMATQAASANSQTPEDPAVRPSAMEIAQRATLFERLRQRCGIQVDRYKDSVVQRQLEQRCAFRGAVGLAQYLAVIDDDPAELDRLSAALLVPVTAFWRDTDAFDALREQCRRMLADWPNGRALRAWVPGCATGEEAYSVAMALLDGWGNRPTACPLQVFATDIDSTALQTARRGRYDAQAVACLPEDLRRRWFQKDSAGHEVLPQLRDVVVFARHDITVDPPFPRLDLVSCRNLLIYLHAPAQVQVLRGVAQVLQPGGLLLLGPTETVREHEAQFQRLRPHLRIYQRSEAKLHGLWSGATDRPERTPLSPAQDGKQARDLLAAMRRTLDPTVGGVATLPSTATGDGSTAPAEALVNAQARLLWLAEQFERVQEAARERSEEAYAMQEELRARIGTLSALNEELQTTNQELATVNAQLKLQSQIHHGQAQQLESVFQSIATPVLVTQDGLTIHSYNEAAGQLLRLSSGSAGLSLAAIRVGDATPDLAACAARASRSAGTVILPLPPLPDGSELEVHAVRRVVEGHCCGAVFSFIDRSLRAGDSDPTRPPRSVEANWWHSLHHSAAMLAVKDLGGRYLWVNEAYARRFGADAQQMLGRSDAALLQPHAARSLRWRDLAALQEAEACEQPEAVSPSADAATDWHWHCERSIIRDPQGQPVALALLAQEANVAGHVPGQSAAVAQIFDVINEGLLLADADHRIERVNAAFTRLTGYQESEVIGSDPSCLQASGGGQTRLEQLPGPLAGRGGWQGEVWKRRKDGREFPAWVSISPVLDGGGQLTHFVYALTDISRLYETRENLQRLATHEPLTGLPNRALLIDRLNHAQETARRRGSELALCFIDLDHFKTINDSLGHDAGDEVIRLAAQRIGENVRSADTLARLGGDEFVLLIENTHRHDALLTVERITRSLSETFMLRGNLLSSTASIGIAMFPGDGEDSATLMRHADAAMYRAKKAGRARFEFFSAEVGDSARARLQLESGLRQALTQQEFHLFYQPQVNVTSGQVVGLEALLRWRPSRGEAVSPAIFLPVAEETALIGHIGDWVLAEACRQLAQWRGQGQELPRLSVNVSARQLRDRQFADRLQQLLAVHALPGHHLMLEITESALLQPNETVLQVLRRIDAMGVQLSLDDFGTGYSSLASLRQLPLKELKIDRSFVQGALEQRDDREIVEAIIGLGRALGLHVVAEGVESEGQWDYFRRQHSSLSLQGYHIARPMNAQRCSEWLQERELTESA
jgi:diguanylate cyclase (GGDEF)-like protein/PAS domain S-box-containing protein